MEYRNLGRTGLKVSPLCLGTMNFGPETTEPDSFRIMDHALELGINFFDTANVYGWKQGEGVTEQIIGRWFHYRTEHVSDGDVTRKPSGIGIATLRHRASKRNPKRNRLKSHRS